MRVRAMTPSGDMQWGSSQQNFSINSPQAVAQLVETRLKLIQGEWFLDQSAGMPWSSQVLGRGTSPTYDQAIRSCILGTPGVSAIESYSSSVGPNRQLSVTATIVTAYDPTPVTVTI